MSSDDAQTRFLEPLTLLQLVERDVVTHGAESASEAIMREPTVLIPVSPPGQPPLDLATYKVRLARWEAGDGPRLAGIRQFVEILAALDAPACSASVQGQRTTYIFLMDAAMSRILATVAIDAP